MDCNKTEILAIEYADGTLAAEDRAALERHAAECAKCAALLQSTAVFFDGLKSSNLPEPDDIFWKKFNDGVFEKIRPSRVSSPRRAHGYYAAAAAAAMLLLSFGIFAGLRGTMPGLQNQPSHIEKATAAANEAEIMLAAVAQSVEVPLFESLYEKTTESDNTADGEHVAQAFEKERYGAPPASVYDIPSEVNNLTEEEAGEILKSLPEIDEQGT